MSFGDFKEYLNELSEEEDKKKVCPKCGKDEEECDCDRDDKDDKDDDKDEDEETNESAQLQLDLITQITKKLGVADVSVLRKIAKILDQGSEE